MTNLTISGKEKIFFGTRRSDDARIFMTRPSWDCDWYWSFGYLGNSREHYHLSSYQNENRTFKDENGKYVVLTEVRNINMFDCLKNDYELSKPIANNLWSFCEQSKTIYQLKSAYEVFHRGGSHYTTHPLKDLIKNNSFAEHISKHLLPQLLQKFWDDFGGKGE